MPKEGMPAGAMLGGVMPKGAEGDGYAFPGEGRGSMRR
jgi:hypothetical protein